MLKINVKETEKHDFKLCIAENSKIYRYTDIMSVEFEMNSKTLKFISTLWNKGKTVWNILISIKEIKSLKSVPNLNVI